MTDRRISLVLLVCAVLLGSCLASCGDDKGSNPTDTTPPGSVANLIASLPTVGGFTLTWTSPGDDWTAGRATEYDVRYSTATITAANWATAAQAAGEPTPKAAGGAETLIVTGLQCNTPYYFALKTRDEVAGNWSGISNVPNATTAACTPLTGLTLIAAGDFTMGSPASEPGRGANEAEHAVTLTKSFYLGDHEVTQGEWRAATGVNPSYFPGDDNRPVEGVSWFEAINFCNTLSSQQGLTPAYAVNGTTVTWSQAANGYRLPTEAEWEYACRAGTQSAYANGGIANLGCDPVDPNLVLMGWYCGNAVNITHPVKLKSANSLGLYDMHGNVWEWCWDWYGDYAPPYTDPTGPTTGTARVIRGGSWDFNAQSSRSASRGSSSNPGTRGDGVGLRLARTAS